MIGCATEILDLTITASTSNTTTVSQCYSYTWAENGQTYTSSGMYSAVTGCNTEILDLTINTTTTSDTTAAVCGSFDWYGNAYSTSGDYTRTLVNQNGCDSVITLHLTINPTPATPGAVSGITEVCSLIGVSTPTTYTVSSVANAATYVWSVPNGVTIQSGQNTNSIDVVFASALASTNQQIRVVAVSSVGCESASYGFITLSKTIPAIPTSISGPTNACTYVGQSTNANYSVVAVAGATSYVWEAPSGASIQAGQGSTAVDVRYTSSFTSGSIKVTAVANCGSRSARTLSITRLLPSSPVAITGPTSVCNYLGTGTEITYSIAAVANADSYSWTIPSGAVLVSGQGTTSVSVRFNGNYATSFIKVRAVSNCFTTGERTLQVSSATYGVPGTISGPTNACPYISNDQLAVYKIRRLNNAAGYIWTVPTGVTIFDHPGGTGANDTIIRVAYDINYVNGSAITVQATGCGTSAPRSLSVGGVIVTTPGLISGPTNACEFMESPSHPTGVTAVYKINKVFGALAYNWQAPNNATIIAHPGGNAENDTIVQIKYNSDFVNGVVRVSASNACGGSGNRSLYVSKLNPSTPSEIDVINLGTCPNRVYSYTISSMPAGATSILWTVPANGTLVSGQGTTSITVSYPTSTVSGYVTAQAINNCSGSSIRTTRVKLSACATTFTTTNNPTAKAVISDVVAFDAVVYPNPTNSSFNLKVTATKLGMVKIRIMDMQGRMVKQATMQSNEIKTIGQELRPGNYIMELMQDQQVKAIKVIKL